jgi:competence protein ComEA
MRPSARGSATAELAGRAVEWFRWVGAGRAIGGSVVVLAVVAGGYWLVRPPELPTEAALPFTSVTTMPVPSPPSTTPVDGTETGGGAPTIVVHVAGSVRSPGVYEVSADARVVDAVEAAGGLAADAVGDAVNLAARLVDGQRVYVPRVGETPPPEPTSGGAPAESVPVGPIDLNSATAAQLETLPGIGPTTAAAIIAYRDLHGPFTSVDDLTDVSGIGDSKLAAIRGLVTV